MKVEATKHITFAEPSHPATKGRNTASRLRERRLSPAPTSTMRRRDSVTSVVCLAKPSLDAPATRDVTTTPKGATTRSTNTMDFQGQAHIYKTTTLHVSAVTAAGGRYHICAPIDTSFTCRRLLRHLPSTTTLAEEVDKELDSVCTTVSSVLANHKKMLDTEGTACDCDVHWLRTGKTAAGEQGCGGSVLGPRQENAGVSKNGEIRDKALVAMAEHDFLCGCGCFDSEREESRIFEA